MREQPLYDRREAIERLGGDAPLFVAMAAMFVAESAGYCQALAAALANADAVELRLQAHTMKSLLATFSFEPGRLLAQRLEDLAAGGDIAGAAALTDEVSGAVVRLADALAADPANTA